MIGARPWRDGIRDRTFRHQIGKKMLIANAAGAPDTIFESRRPTRHLVGLAGRHLLHVADLFRLLGLLRHGRRSGRDVGIPASSRTSIPRTRADQSPISGADGISRCRAGFATICTFRWAEPPPATCGSTEPANVFFCSAGSGTGQAGTSPAGASSRHIPGIRAAEECVRISSRCPPPVTYCTPMLWWRWSAGILSGRFACPGHGLPPAMAGLRGPCFGRRHVRGSYLLTTLYSDPRSRRGSSWLRSAPCACWRWCRGGCWPGIQAQALGPVRLGTGFGLVDVAAHVLLLRSSVMLLASGTTIHSFISGFEHKDRPKNNFFTTPSPLVGEAG